MKKRNDELYAKPWLGLRGGWRSLGVIVLAAVLLELVSALQYHYAHHLLEREMEHRLVTELHVKVFALRQTLNSAEQTLREHLWDVNRCLRTPDSLYNAISRVISVNDKVVGSFLAFVPDYYPQKGRLFEPYAYQSGDTIAQEQIGGRDGHDYTEHPAFLKMQRQKEPFWSDPYEYEGTIGKQALTTYTYPITDSRDSLIAVYGLDVSLAWLGDTLNARRHHPNSFDLLLTESHQLVGGPSERIVSHKRCEEVVSLINDSTLDQVLDFDEEVRYIHFYDRERNDHGNIYYMKMRAAPYWVVAMVCYDKEVYGALDSMRLYIGLLILVGFVLVGFIIHRLINNILRMQRTSMEQERIGSELRIARNIQTSMLPKQFPPFPERTDIDLYGVLVPAREVGGDLFDFFIRDEKLYFCIGDVSGKGIPAAMVMAQTHSLFRLATAKDSDAGHILHVLNEMLCQNNESNMFITFFLGILDLPTGRLRYCNAGHDKPVLVGQGPLDANPHLPLGVFADTRYDMQTLVMEPGMTIFLYTDGLTEAKSSLRQMLGLQTVLDNLTPQTGCQALVTHVKEVVDDFVQDAEQSDDLTMLAIRYQPQRAVNVLDEELTLANDVRQTRQLNGFVKRVCERLGMADRQVKGVRLAVEEAVVNVMEYAYPPGQQGDVIVAMRSDGQRLTIVIRDHGAPFDPTEQHLADTSLSAEERPVGGLGLLLMRELTDSINYEREPDSNVLTLQLAITHNE